MSDVATNEVPVNWEVVPLKNVVSLQKGKKPKDLGELSEERDIPYIDIKAFETGEIRKYCTDEKVVLCKEDDVLVVWDGSRSGLVGFGAKGAVGSTIAKVDPSGMHSKYLFYFLQSNFKYLNTNTRGVGIPHVDPGVFNNLEFPVAPLEQQKHIVAKIEELFSHIDAGIEALKKAKQLLKQYRQSVLKAAVTGELTKEWREANKAKLEPTTQLLERILKERREKWEEQQLEQFKAKGKIPKDDSWKDKYIEPKVFENSGYEIPDTWIMARAEQVCDFITKGTTPKKDKLSAGKGEIPFIKVYNLTFDTSLNFDIDPTFTDKETHEGFLARSKVFPGDVLMNIVGPPLGKVSIVSELFDEWNINQAIAVYRPITGLNNRLLAYFLLGKPVVEWMLSKTKTTAGQVNLTLEISRDAPIPIMPEEEQKEIINLIEVKLAASDRMLEELEVQLIKAEKNKQSVLASAFTGTLKD